MIVNDLLIIGMCECDTNDLRRTKKVIRVIQDLRRKEKRIFIIDLYHEGKELIAVQNDK